MRHIVAGTAGHIDHGKTALVRALTGVDTDRLEEEKKRGISIDLGFAHTDLSATLRIAFVDVPGHERFIKNMLAGVGGIDLVLFVIAADESIKPQTREHFEICRLLGIRHGIVVFTKADLVDPDLLELVRLETEEFIAGSFLDGAPMIPVSSVTGSGLDQLRIAVAAVAQKIAARSTEAYLRLPVDRSFAMKGFGTVVTGTLTNGSVSLEQEVEAHPGGHRMRVRGIQVHGALVKSARAGQRTALNLAGTDPDELFRGTVLAEAGRYRPTQQIDCMVELLPSAKPLKHRAPVHFHSGTSEIEAEVRTLEGTDPVAPGSRAPVRLLLSEPRLILPNDKFILRMFSPVVTIGGGVVLDIDVPPELKRPQLLQRMRILDGAGLSERLELLIREAEPAVELAQLVARTGETEAAINAALPKSTVRLGAWFADRDRLKNTIGRWREVVRAFHQTNPLLPGISKEEFRSRELPGEAPGLFEAMLATASDLVTTAEILHLRSHKLAFKQDEAEALGRIEAAFESAGLAVPSVQEVLAASGVEAGRAKSLLQILLRERKLVKVGEELVFHTSALMLLRDMLSGRKGERFSVPEFKEWTGISRKYAIPLLEYLDRERVTRRDGDSRIVL